jgi:hypothetical protein
MAKLGSRSANREPPSFGCPGGPRSRPGFLPREAAGDEERVDILAHTALDVGEDPVADGKDAVVRDDAADLVQPPPREVIDRRMRLAEIEALAPISV